MIKYLISSLFVLLIVSFSASADEDKFYRVNSSDNCSSGSIQAGTLEALGVKWAAVGCFSDTVKPCTFTHADGRYLYCDSHIDFYGTYQVKYQTIYATCPLDKVRDDYTGECVDIVPFCERSDTINQMNQFKDACFDKGWKPMVSCTDSTEALEMSCNPPPEPDKCTPDSSDWPACKDDEPKQCTPDSPDYPNCCDASNNYCDNPIEDDSCTIFSANYPACAGDDLDPPDSGDLGDPDKPNGGGGGGTNDPKDEPPVESDNDNAVDAVEKMNADLNKQLTAINNDLNKNHGETISNFDALKQSIDLNTDTIVDAANHTKNAIDNQTNTLSSLADQNNDLLTSLNHLNKDGFDTLNGGLTGIENAIGEQTGDLTGAINGLKEGLEDIADGSNTTVNGGNCTDSFSCNGNAYECYIARQEWETACALKDLSGGGEAYGEGQTRLAADGDALGAKLGDYNDSFNDPDLLKDGSPTDVSTLFSEYDESNGFSFSEQCPASSRVDYGLGSFVINYQPFCDLALYVRALVMLLSGYGAFLVIAKFS